MKLPKFSLSSVSTFTISISTVLIVLGAVPFTENIIDDTKLYLLFLTALVLGVIFSVAIIRRGAIELILSRLTYAVVAFLTAIAASTFFVNQYPVKAILSYGGIFIAAGAIVLFASPLLTKKSKQTWITVFNATVSLLVITSLLELIGVGPSRLLPLVGPFTAPTISVLFNLSGTILTALQLCIIGVVGIFATWLSTKKAHFVEMGMAVIMLIGILIYGYYLLPGKSGLQFPSFGASWSIALDSVRDPRGALIGAGAGSYVDAFQRFRPVWVNSTASWNTIFNTGANMPLTILTISGFIGLAAWVSLVAITFSESKKAKQEDVAIVAMLLATIGLELLLLPSTVIIAVQAILLALFIASKRHDFGVLHFSFFHAKVHRLTQILPVKDTEPRWPLFLSSGVVLVMLGFSAFYLGRFYMASYYSLAAAKAYENNDGLGVYNSLQQSVTYNPYSDVYHRRYASIAVGIAEVISQKTDKTDQDTQSVSDLIQQAVREGQAAVSLNPTDGQNYAQLASIYQRLTGGVDGAETFAEQYFVQAISFFPTAPDLYVSLAGIYIKQEKWSQAASVLDQGLQVKSDYPSTLYNLGYVLEKQNDFANAKSAYERTQSYLTDTTSEDYVALSKKIEELGKIVAEQKAAADKEAAANPQTGAAPAQNQNPSAVEMNLNNQQLTPPQGDVQVNQQTLPSAEPTAPASEQPAPPAPIVTQ
ncbi:hypothetical protein KA012_02515 [Candidatus Woesebacteria bacterium]|nr:hypothetical protein [Candidatus Woesebacteria bacterium]